MSRPTNRRRAAQGRDCKGASSTASVISDATLEKRIMPLKEGIEEKRREKKRKEDKSTESVSGSEIINRDAQTST
jgi:hypothetical protein